MSGDNLGMVLATIVALALVASPVACSMSDNAAVQSLVKGGSDPVSARCAVSPSSSPNMCLVHAAGGVRK